jgi:hypothetical protein
MNVQFYNAMRAEGIAAWKKLGWVKQFLSRKFGWKWYLGHENHDGFAPRLPFYLFWCSHCEHPSKDTPSGLPKSKYLVCRNCFTRRFF